MGQTIYAVKIDKITKPSKDNYDAVAANVYTLPLRVSRQESSILLYPALQSWMEKRPIAP